MSREKFEKDWGIAGMPKDKQRLFDYAWRAADKARQPEIDALRARVAGLEGAPGNNLICEFGKGYLLVDTGIFVGKPAVFISSVTARGPVGDIAPEQEQGDRNTLKEGEIVMRFPTEEQAKAVADALVGQSLAPPAPMVPEGWKLVPIDPTDEMRKAGCAVPLNKAARHNAVYRAMLAAAPEPKPADVPVMSHAEAALAITKTSRDWNRKMRLEAEAERDQLRAELARYKRAIDTCEGGSLCGCSANFEDSPAAAPEVE